METVKISELIGKGFYASRGAVRCGCSELVESGGRGSGKSSYLSVELLLQLIKHPGCHAVVLRKIGATLRTSVYAQILWAVGALGLGGHFRFTLSPLEAEYLPTGQKILFLGMDDPGKLKSIKMPFGYIGIAWFEELDQFEEEEVRSAEQSLFRGGAFSLSLKSFNPPANPGHWVNQCRTVSKKGRFCHHSTYLELPESWLGQRFLADAAHLRRVNPVLYRHEYLGECVGFGEQVFPNLYLIPTKNHNNQNFSTFSTFFSEKVTNGNEKIDLFDIVTNGNKKIDLFDLFAKSRSGGFPAVSGVDWGWFPDPWAFNRIAYDAENRVLFILDEATRHRCANRETGELVKERIRPGETVIADSSEEKSIADYRQLGIRCRGVKKGAGSVAYGMKWLQSLSAIVIDPERCPDTAREFSEYVYVKGEYPDKDNHHIDAVRYAATEFWRRTDCHASVRTGSQ